jgi:L-alanine-DL-glutamate epimerase-like enolase superfamily enzyme
LGTKNDKEIIDTVRDCTEKPVRVDANEGWDLQTAMEMCEWLSGKNIEFVEQPLPADQLDKTAILRSSSPIPIFADENCMTSQDCPTYFDDISNPESGVEKLVPFAGGMKSLEAAFSMAVFDVWTQKQKLPLYSYFGVEAAVAPVTSFTIAIGELDSIQEKIKEAEPYAILKIKLGTKNDKEIIDTVRDCTEKPVRVDANEGWDLQTAMEMCEWLSGKNIEFVEQPLPADQLDKTAILRSSSPIPIFADENCMTSQDCPTYFDDISNPESGVEKLVPFAGGMKSLEAAFSMAVFDVWTQKQKLPLYSYFGVEAAVAPVTSFTIAIGELDSIQEKIKEAEPYSILKVKLGTPAMDQAIIQEIRQHTDKVIRVDANEGWQTDTALELCK